VISHQRFGTKSQGELDNFIGYDFETFRYDELSYRCVGHVLVPKHELISKAEVNKLFSQEKPDGKILRTAKLTELPTMYDTDPVSKWFHFRPGDVIRVYRTIPEKSIFYRLVIRGGGR
jgi:DNA-directed RNA polymerase subunit H (RpoH/RPB5)